MPRPLSKCVTNKNSQNCDNKITEEAGRFPNLEVGMQKRSDDRLEMSEEAYKDTGLDTTWLGKWSRKTKQEPRRECCP